MRSRRLLVVLLGATATLVAAAPASAKEGVRATLTSPVQLNAAAGTRLRISWKLASKEGPFGANGVFVRLRSTTGSGAETGVAAVGAYDDGRYSATVVVPEGGIGDVQIGLQGFSDGKSAPMFFPITNDPLPGPLHVAASPPRDGGGTGTTTWILAAVGGVIVVLFLAAGAVLRRRSALAAP